MEKNKIIFITPTIEAIKEIFKSTNMEGLTSISDHYWLVADENDSNCHTCTLTDMLVSDLRSLDDNNIYCDLIDKYGIDIVDKFIHHDLSSIENKLANLIKFTFENVCKSDELEVILYMNDTNLQQGIMNMILIRYDAFLIASDEKEKHIDIYNGNIIKVLNIARRL